MVLIKPLITINTTVLQNVSLTSPGSFTLLQVGALLMGVVLRLENLMPTVFCLVYNSVPKTFVEPRGCSLLPRAGSHSSDAHPPGLRTSGVDAKPKQN